jgi:hypothetical protein
MFQLVEGKMKFKGLFSVYVVVLLVIGSCLLLIPGPYMELYGATLQPPGFALARFYGVAMLGVGWMVWKGRDSNPSHAVDGLIQGNILVWILSAVVAVQGQIEKTFNYVGLSVIGLSLFFLGCYGYIQIRDRQVPKF